MSLSPGSRRRPLTRERGSDAACSSGTERDGSAVPVNMTLDLPSLKRKVLAFIGPRFGVACKGKPHAVAPAFAISCRRRSSGTEPRSRDSMVAERCSHAQHRDAGPDVV